MLPLLPAPRPSPLLPAPPLLVVLSSVVVCFEARRHRRGRCSLLADDLSLHTKMSTNAHTHKVHTTHNHNTYVRAHTHEDGFKFSQACGAFKHMAHGGAVRRGTGEGGA